MPQGRGLLPGGHHGAAGPLGTAGPGCPCPATPGPSPALPRDPFQPSAAPEQKQRPKAILVSCHGP